MQGKGKFRVVLFVLGAIIFCFSTLVNAVNLNCSAYGQTAYYNLGTTITIPISPVELSKNSLDVVLTDMKNYAKCGGEAKPGFGDAVRTQSLTLSSVLTNLGYTGYIISNDGAKILSPLNICTWIDGNCSIINNWSGTTALKVQVGMQRNANSGNWRTATTIDSGTEIASMISQFRYSAGTYWGTTFKWSFVLSADMVIPASTCSITQYDSSVTLPSVTRSDIVSHGTGRYPNAKKAFKFNLACDPQTGVSVTFEGDTLSGTGTDSVLKNKLSGNDNVGIQLLFNDSSPVKMTEKLEVVNSAQATELLSFNAYYYYKGGNISGGPVKANTTFTFEYQ